MRVYIMRNALAKKKRETQKQPTSCQMRMPRPNFKTFLKFLCLLLLAAVLLVLAQHYRTLRRQQASMLVYVDDDIDKPQVTELIGIDAPSERLAPEGAHHIWVRDWHDYKAMKRDAERKGIGEQGKPAKLKKSQRGREKELLLKNGFNALLSDSISVNRSVPDIRYYGCYVRQYRVKLPTVSIIIPFCNEYFSVLVRSVHSLVNRSPPELLKEIILVDDFSDHEYLFKQLDQYVAENFHMVQIVRLTKRTGLIGARMAGARKATAEVLVFLDSHIEANYNWLPPLLELIAANKRNVVCPFIDIVDDKTFAYSAQDEGARGAFDWNFEYKRLDLLPQDEVDPTRPFRSPVMAGGLFAISTEFFWKLGGYDEGLQIWGGEQYELSFKIWMCGGEMFDAPCSRIGHIYRGEIWVDGDPAIGDYLHRNLKRVAEVWMDQYKEYLYKRNSKVYADIDTGDLSKQKALREQLHCKSFKWFMENVAFDLMKKYPPVEPPDYAFGAIQSLTAPSLCVDITTMQHGNLNPIRLFECAHNLKNPHANQDWALTWHRDLRLRSEEKCLDVKKYESATSVWPENCHGLGGNQMWYYDTETKWLTQGRRGAYCLEAKPKTKTIELNKCVEGNHQMCWMFGNINYTALESYYEGLPENVDYEDSE